MVTAMQPAAPRGKPRMRNPKLRKQLFAGQWPEHPITSPCSSFGRFLILASNILAESEPWTSSQRTPNYSADLSLDTADFVAATGQKIRLRSTGPHRN